MNYFREHALLDYFGGGFDGEAEGSAAGARLDQPGIAPSFVDRPAARWRRTSRSSTRPTRSCPAKAREGYTLVLAMRSWEFEAFGRLRRPAAA